MKALGGGRLALLTLRWLQAASLFTFLNPTVLGTHILLTNDGGWAVGIICAQSEASTLFGYDLRLSSFQQ
jgi:hypothetical protein